MKKNSFRDSLRPKSAPQIPDQALDELAQLAKPYAHMNEAQLIRTMEDLSRNPGVQKILAQHSEAQITSALAPYLNEAQRKKLSTLLARFHP